MATAEQLKIQLTADNQASAPINKLRNDVKSLGEQADKTAVRLAASNGKISNGFTGMGRKAGQAGIQVQQLVGQIQGGTNPMLALSQQATDLGFVLGVPLLGAVAGLAASLAMTLMPSLKETQQTTTELLEDFGKLSETIKNDPQFRGAVIRLFEQDVQDNMAAVREQALKINNELKLMGQTGGAIKELIDLGILSEETKLAGLATSQTNTELDKEVITLGKLSEKLIKSEQDLALFRGTVIHISQDQQKLNDSHSEYIKKLEEEMLTFGMNADQKARFKMLGMPDEYRETAIAIHEKIMAQKAEMEQSKENARVQEEIKKSSIEGFNKLASQNKKLFQVQKAYNIANAIMDAYAGANKALAYYPPPISYAMAAGQIALGMANVATIKSQSFSGRAVGGRVEAGTPYMVGEQGREMFIPSTRGEIVKNSDVEAMGGSRGAVNVNFTINAVDTRGFSELLSSRRSQIVNMVNQAMNDRGRAGVTA